VKRDLEFVRTIWYGFGINKVEHIFLIANAGTIITPLDLIEGGVLPIGLGTGTDLSVAAGDNKMCKFDGHLIDIVMIELIDKRRIQR
jgi:hypothetical protein